MGRPRLYHTEEERLTAARARSSRYYSANKKSICTRRRAKYQDSKEEVPQEVKPNRRSRAPPMTDEEKKVKNRDKSRRYYQRNKSQIATKRRNGYQTANSRLCDDRTIRLFKEGWQRHIAYHAAQLPRQLGNISVDEFLEGHVRQYLKDGLSSAFGAECDRFTALLNRTQEFQSEVWNKLGAGVELEQVSQVIVNIRNVIHYLQDLEVFAMEEGRAGFLEAYLHGLLSYQQSE